MNVLIASACCSREKEKAVWAMRNRPMIIPSQKFFDLIIRGMAQDKSTNITCLTAIPVSKSTCSIKSFDYESEIVSEDLRCNYIPFKNGKITRFLTVIYNTFKYTKKWCKEHENEDCVLITDTTTWHCAIPARIAAKLCKVKTVACITDLPDYTNIKHKSSSVKAIINSALRKLINADIKKYDGYVLLTAPMYDVVCPKKDRPYLIVEGSIDPLDIHTESINSTENKKIFMYAGGVYEKYGVKAFAEAFEKVGCNDAEFWVFGDGDFAKEIVENRDKYPHVIYKGCVSLEEIVKYERMATVLVNPRPTTDEYTKYSFPSKTAEYMTTGVPVLSTKLAGIPKEYAPYALWFDESSENGYIDGINTVLSMNEADLKELGKNAQNFCKEHKTNVVQGGKIITFVSNI